MTFEGTVGVHFLPHHPGWEHLTARHHVDLAHRAATGEAECVWFATRLLSRDALTLMAAIASRVDISLGTLVANPWSRNPLELASSLGVLTELLEPGRELRFGMGSGVSHARWVERPKPLRFVRETIELVRTVMHGELANVDQYPTVSDYFHLHGAAQLSVPVEHADAVSFWFALTGGPIGDQLAVDVADGVILDAGTVQGLGALVDGRVERYAARIDGARADRHRASARKILNLCMSVSEDRDAAFARAREHARIAAGRNVKGAIGADVQLTDDELRRSFLVGTPAEVAEVLADCMEHAGRIGCEHIVLGVPTGPDPAEAVELASSVVIPSACRGQLRKGNGTVA